MKVELLAENSIGRGFYRKIGFEEVEKGEVELFGDKHDSVIRRKKI